MSMIRISGVANILACLFLYFFIGCLLNPYQTRAAITTHSDLNLAGVTGQNECGLATTRFAVIGDYGDDGSDELDVANLVKSWNPEFITTVGDNNYPDGEAETIDENIGQYYQEFIGNYTGSYGPGAPSNNFFPTLGNHDWSTKSGNPPLPYPYLDYFTLPGNERYYNFVRGPVEFFALDSDSDEPHGRSSTSVQGMWLQNALAASSASWKLVYMHNPPYSSSSRHGSEDVMQWPYKEWGATAVLAGHDHVYERIIHEGFPYFVNGLGGRNIYEFDAPVPGSIVRYNDDYGAMLVEATSYCITFQFISRNDILIDTYTLRKEIRTLLPLIIKE